MALPAAAIASIASAALTTAGNIALSERQRKMNEANQDKMNDYNLPVNQIQRLKDAGINPNALTMSNGMNVQGNTSASMNPYSTPALSDPMSMIANSFLTYSQGKTEDQMRDIRKQEAAMNISVMFENASNLHVDTQYKSILNSFAAAKEYGAVVGQFRQNELSVWNTKKVKEEARSLAFNIDKILPQELKNLIAQENIYIGQLDQIIATVANINKDTELKDSQIDVNDTQAALNVEERGLTSQQSANYQDLTNLIMAQYRESINKIIADTDLTEQQAYYYLLELSQKYRIQGAGLLRGGSYRNAKGIQDATTEKYGIQE